MKEKLKVRLDAYLDRWARSYLPRYLLKQHHYHGDPNNLEIAPTAIVNNALFNVGGGRCVVGEWVFFGYGVNVMCGYHDYTKFDEERQKVASREGNDVIIEQGAWLATNAMVVGPCTIGRHSVVAAGSLVLHDVPPYTLVAGVPARVIKEIPRPPEDP